MRIECSNFKNNGKYIQPCDDILISGHWFHVMATTPRVIIVRTLVEYLSDNPDYKPKK